jgi:dihydropteroate synthase
MNQSSLHSEPRANYWSLRTRRLTFGPLPALMGIVNVTPDSFSDGGSYWVTQTAIDHALRLEDAGADLLDIGGESTRPYSESVSLDEELRRVIPVIEGLQGRVACPLSIDTSKAPVARAAIDLGVELINDVTGLDGDPDMVALAAQSGVGVCAMHMRGTPQTMQDSPHYTNVVEEIFLYLRERQQALRQSGIAAPKICLDPGIGFGKTHAHNWELLRASHRFLELGSPILIGHSRKGFIADLLGNKQLPRDAGTLGISLMLAGRAIQVLRVHEIAATRQALLCWHAAGGADYSPSCSNSR